MLRALDAQSTEPGWLDNYWLDFQRRFVNLLGYQFRVSAISAISFGIVTHCVACIRCVNVVGVHVSLFIFILTHKDMKSMYIVVSISFVQDLDVQLTLIVICILVGQVLKPAMCLGILERAMSENPAATGRTLFLLYVVCLFLIIVL